MLRAPISGESTPKVLEAESGSQRESYDACWRVPVEVWGARRVDEPTPTEILQVMN